MLNQNLNNKKVITHSSQNNNPVLDGPNASPAKK